MMLTLGLLVLFIVISTESKRFSRETSFQRKLRDNEYSIFSLYSSPKDDAGISNSLELERDQLYEAYNLLHTLAQVGYFGKLIESDRANTLCR